MNTLGPWFWKGNDLYGGSDGKSCVIDSGCGCCRCYDTSESDAALIKAAPDLLQALKNLVICSERWEDTHTALVMESARSAIENATKKTA